MLKGYFVAAVTPFNDGKLDIQSFENYIAGLVASGISGIVVCGSTGESFSLSQDEKAALIKSAAAVNKGKSQLHAGIIDSATDRCLSFIREVEDYVDGFLCICPFYIKPSQEQIYNHFLTLSQSTERDVVLYNNPSRVGSSIEFGTLKKLCELKNVIGIKECRSDLSVFTLWRLALKRDFSFLAGNDDSAAAALSMGASGVISVSANVAPELCAQMYAALTNGDVKRFAELRDRLAPLHELMFSEPSPGPVKYALSRSGLLKNELRMPLSPISAQLEEKINSYLCI
jgi:4-hydroxy-tetrahydrodipicolinate synthase